MKYFAFMGFSLMGLNIFANESTNRVSNPMYNMGPRSDSPQNINILKAAFSNGDSCLKKAMNESGNRRITWGAIIIALFIRTSSMGNYS